MDPRTRNTENEELRLELLTQGMEKNLATHIKTTWMDK